MHTINFDGWQTFVSVSYHYDFIVTSSQPKFDVKHFNFVREFVSLFCHNIGLTPVGSH